MQLKNKVVSEGTLDEAVLEQRFRSQLSSLREDIVDDVNVMDLAELMCELDSCAPDGYFFGSHPDDPTQFGFWEQVEEELLDEDEDY